VLADGGVKDVAFVVGEAKRLRPAVGSGMPGEHLVAEIFVGLPGDPNRAISGDGQGRIIVLAVGRARDLLRSGCPMDQDITVEERQRAAALEVSQADFESALR